jgi:hypothetical protein
VSQHVSWLLTLPFVTISFIALLFKDRPLDQLLPVETPWGDRDSDPSHPEGNFMSFINDDS